jgi:hypothetical protein
MTPTAAPAQKPRGPKPPLNSATKADVLKSFYRNTVGTIFPDTFVPTPHAVDQNGGA